MDNNNMATIFCPKCGKEMKPFDREPSKAVNF
jgi:NMD protein affecting ribosome stability and mRNA decay